MLFLCGRCDGSGLCRERLVKLRTEGVEVRKGGEGGAMFGSVVFLLP